MTIHAVTLEAQIAEVERLIQYEKRCGGTAEELRAIAADLRARLAHAPSVALVELERRITAVARSRTSSGPRPMPLHVLGEGVVAHWPVIKQSMEKFAAEIENA